MITACPHALVSSDVTTNTFTKKCTPSSNSSVSFTRGGSPWIPSPPPVTNYTNTMYSFPPPNQNPIWNPADRTLHSHPQPQTLLTTTFRNAQAQKRFKWHTLVLHVGNRTGRVHARGGDYKSHNSLCHVCNYGSAACATLQAKIGVSRASYFY